MKHHLLTAAMLVAALVLYSVGMTGGGLAFFFVGAMCEVWSWARILRHRTST